MNEFQIGGRYPKMLPKPPSQAEADAILPQAEEVFTWLMQK